jgi:4-amino-4-deoxy-L-arabinose transferase-like glycosyltransferase
MTAVYCYRLKKYFEEENYKTISLLGLSIALLLYAKYHGVLLIFFTIVAIPELFKRKSFYLVALIAFIAFFPHILWQYQHNFSTLRYHFLERPSSAFRIEKSLEYLLLQLLLPGLFVGPVVWYGVFKKKIISNFDRSMKFICIGTVIFFLFSGFNKKIEANWTIFLTIPLIYLTNSLQLWTNKWIVRLLYVSFSIVVSFRILLTFSPELIKIKRLTEFHGWKNWSSMVNQICGHETIIANTYQIASKLSFYLQKEVDSLNYKSRKNQFDYWEFEKKNPTEKLCYLTDKKQFSGVKIETPDGKTLLLIKNQSAEDLWRLKLPER